MRPPLELRQGNSLDNLFVVELCREILAREHAIHLRWSESIGQPANLGDELGPCVP